MRLFTLTAVLLILACPAPAANPGDEVVVIYNTRIPESKDVADHYAEKRQVPKDHIFGFSLPTSEDMTRSEFHDLLERPLAHALEQERLWRIRSVIAPGTNSGSARAEWRVVDAKIRYAVLCYGVPLRITRDPNLKESAAESLPAPLRSRNEAAVDSELALLPQIEQNLSVSGPRINPVYGTTNATALHPTNGILMVARLDGPSAAIARGLVDKAIVADTNGLWGRAYFDLRDATDPNYKTGDNWIKGAADVFRFIGFETAVEETSATFPPEYPMSHIAFYCGWYDPDVSGPFAQTNVEFMPGAFAYHLHSYSAATLRSANQNWTGPLLAKGATIAMGSVEEPYLTGTPNVAVFAARLTLSSFTFGEAAYASQPVLSWQTTVVGDPLYRPFGNAPRALHEKLEASHGPALEWSVLRLLNLSMINGTQPRAAAEELEGLKFTKQSSVLTEKLADLYSAQGKPSSAAEMYQRALQLNPSPQQRVRLRLALAEKLIGLDRNQEAIEDLARVLQENPAYPAKIEIYKKLAPLARKLGKNDAAANYEQRIKELAPTPK
jgi:uncharacterized protein (TIGR03790 family)